MERNQKKMIYGLIGYPVKHSYSALMHNAAFAHYQMDAEYRLFEVPPDQLDEFFRKTVPEKKIRGFNVTVPHKENALVYLNADVSLAVKTIGAVNTIRVEDDGAFSGYNTDAEGFLRDLKEHGVEVFGKVVSLIGAGGGAKAVAFAVCDQKPKQLLIYDIDTKKTGLLVKRIETFYPALKVEAASSMESLEIRETDLLINATPVGMKREDAALVKDEWFHPNLFVYDLIYNPSQTKLLQSAKAVGCRYANGLGMLLYQGCLAFEHWTGKEAPVDVMRKALMGRSYA